MAKSVAEIAWTPNEAFNNSDWDAFAACLTDDVTYLDPTTGVTHAGIEAQLANAQMWKSIFPDVTGKATNTVSEGNQAFFEIVWTGTHQGDFPLPSGQVLAPTGITIQVPAAMVVTVRGDKVKHTTHYLDLMSMLGQLGAFGS